MNVSKRQRATQRNNGGALLELSTEGDAFNERFRCSWTTRTPASCARAVCPSVHTGRRLDRALALLVSETTLGKFKLMRIQPQAMVAQLRVRYAVLGTNFRAVTSVVAAVFLESRFAHNSRFILGVLGSSCSHHCAFHM